MSNRCQSWAWRQRAGGGTHKLVLVKLADIANDEGECWRYSQTKLADHCECSVRTLRRSIKHLASEKINLVREEERPGKCSRYFLNLEESDTNKAVSDPGQIDRPDPGQGDRPNPGHIDRPRSDPGQDVRGTPDTLSGHPGQDVRQSILYPENNNHHHQVDDDGLKNSTPAEGKPERLQRLAAYTKKVVQWFDQNGYDIEAKSRTPKGQEQIAKWLDEGVMASHLDMVLARANANGIEIADPLAYVATGVERHIRNTPTASKAKAKAAEASKKVQEQIEADQKQAALERKQWEQDRENPANIEAAKLAMQKMKRTPAPGAVVE